MYSPPPACLPAWATSYISDLPQPVRPSIQAWPVLYWHDFLPSTTYTCFLFCPLQCNAQKRELITRGANLLQCHPNQAAIQLSLLLHRCLYLYSLVQCHACPTSSMPYLHQSTRSTHPMSPFQPCAYEDPSLLPPSVLVPVKDIQCSDLVTSVQVYQPALLDYILYNPNPGCSTTFSPATRLPVILPFSPPVQDPTCPSSSMPFQFNSRPARTCLSNSSSPALHQCTRSTCHILYQPGLLYP